MPESPPAQAPAGPEAAPRDLTPPRRPETPGAATERAEAPVLGVVPPESLVIEDVTPRAPDPAPGHDDPPEPDSVDVLVSGLPEGRVQPVRLWPDPVLREVADAVADMDWPALSQLAADLLETLYAAGGRGLAAPQIGVARRIFVMDAGWRTGEADPRVILDPEVLWRAESESVAEELCLSAPDTPVPMRRPDAIRLGWFTLDGIAVVSDLSGIEARIALHELDHLNGLLIVDPAHPGRATAPAPDRT